MTFPLRDRAWAAWRIGLVFACLAGAQAEAAEDCNGYGNLQDASGLSMARIGGPDRTYFIKGGSESAGCPNKTAACRARAYLVPGDRVIVGGSRADFTCVDYVDAKGDERAGWMPTPSLTGEPQTPVIREDWLGTWVREEATITIASGPARGLKIKGDATYGARDPDRVKHGALNLGEMAGDVIPDGAKLAFDDGLDKTFPVSKGDEFDCKVWMRRLGPYLLVDDNNQCGGVNVTFRGTYLPKRAVKSAR